MSTYAIGDVQGCYDDLQNLLSVIDYRSGQDQLWFLGDLINRGPKNLETVDFVRHEPGALSVLGNHDLHFLAVALGHSAAKRKDTFTDLLDCDDLTSIIDWLRYLPLAYHAEQFNSVLVHAGVPPVWSLPQALVHAQEVEAVLRSGDYNHYFANMYGNQPDTWSDDLDGVERLRVITNYFTRMRFCDQRGRLEFTHKSRQQPDGFQPWFEFERPATDDVQIVFGHWAALQGLDRDHFKGVDTGCVWGRALSALRLEDQRWFRVPAQQR